MSQTKIQMKATGLNLLFLPLLLITFVSCKDEETPPVVTNAEAAEEVSGVISSDFVTLGVDTYILVSDAAENRSYTSLECGVLKDTTITRVYSGDLISYGYTLDYQYQLTCTTQGIPTALTWTYSSDGVWNGVRFNVIGESSGSMTVTDILPSKDAFVLNGSLNRTQVTIQKNRDQKTLNTQSSIQISDFSLDKNTGEITGGTAVFTSQGVLSTGPSYSYSCTVVFNGDGTATLSFVNGDTYTLNLDTWEIE